VYVIVTLTVPCDSLDASMLKLFVSKVILAYELMEKMVHLVVSTDATKDCSSPSVSQSVYFSMDSV
jgi:hypothetical protein